MAAGTNKYKIDENELKHHCSEFYGMQIAIRELLKLDPYSPTFSTETKGVFAQAVGLCEYLMLTIIERDGLIPELDKYVQVKNQRVNDKGFNNKKQDDTVSINLNVHISFLNSLNIFPSEIHTHLNSIRINRNKVLHYSREKSPYKLDKKQVSKGTIASLGNSMNDVFDWFLDNYLDKKYDHLKNKEFNPDDLATYQSKFENPIVTKKNTTITILVFVVLFLVIYILPVSEENADNTNIVNSKDTAVAVNTASVVATYSESPKMESIDQKKAMAINVLTSYYNGIIENTFEATNFFSYKVNSYKRLEDKVALVDIDADDINISFVKDKNLLNPLFEITEDHIESFGKVEGGYKLVYIDELSEFKEDSKIQPLLKIKLELIFDLNLKITSLIETDFQDTN